MKKPFLLGCAYLLVMALVFLGPELLDIYRLDRYMTESSQAQEGDGGPWPRLSDACIGCHGPQGRSLHAGYPSLAGQPAAYIATQLKHFASGKRANPTMGPLAMSLSDGEMEKLAAYFAKQMVSTTSAFAVDPLLRERGQALVQQGGCAACHGERLLGQGAFPRLAGQGPDYLVAQLDAFAAGMRSEASGAMQRLATATPAADRQAMAAYLASLSGQAR